MGRRKNINRGRHYNRIFHEPPADMRRPGWVNRERVFAEAWEAENEPRISLNHGHGILQDLFIDLENPVSAFSGRRVTHVVSCRERMIVATAIQWLGSNVGWSFLHEVVDRCGYLLVRKEK